MAAVFASAVSCIDGRVQIPIIEYIKSRYEVLYVDMITEPGADMILAENRDMLLLESIKRRVKISVERHDSGLVAVAGHHDCAANPVSQEKHMAQILASVSVVESWGFPVKVIGMWVDSGGRVREIPPKERS